MTQAEIATLAPPPPPIPLPAEIQAALEERIAQGTLALPILPEVATRVISMTADPHCDLKRLADVIRRDQAMAAHLLRIANSPIYAGAYPVTNLQQCLSRLGITQIRMSALMISCKSRVFNVKGYQNEVRVLFRHSFAAALFAQEIARTHRWNVEEAFLCGLLHDIGRPVLLQAIVDLQQELKITADRQATLDAITHRHTEVGASLMTKWALPDRVGETILYHHDPLVAPNARQSAVMTRLADDLSHLLVGPKKLNEDNIKGHPMLEPLNMYPDEVDALLDHRDAVLGTVDAVT